MSAINAADSVKRDKGWNAYCYIDLRAHNILRPAFTTFIQHGYEHCTNFQTTFSSKVLKKPLQELKKGWDDVVGGLLLQEKVSYTKKFQSALDKIQSISKVIAGNAKKPATQCTVLANLESVFEEGKHDAVYIF